jgi:pyrroloquinoline quinone (PQQ) biosynthesis protein C
MHDARLVAQRLRLAVGSRDYRAHPFVQTLRRRAYSTDSLRYFAQTLYRSTEEFVTLLYRLAAICPLPLVRAQIVANLLEEEGFAASASGVTCHPARRHAELCKRFALAVGVENHALSPPPTGSISGRWFDDALENQRWIAVLAHLTVGQESAAPTMFGATAQALAECYGIAESALVFFTEHVEADRVHAERGVELCARVAVTPGLEAEALEGARRGASHAWSTYRMLDVEMRRISAQ